MLPFHPVDQSPPPHITGTVGGLPAGLLLSALAGSVLCILFLVLVWWCWRAHQRRVRGTADSSKSRLRPTSSLNGGGLCVGGGAAACSDDHMFSVSACARTRMHSHAQSPYHSLLHVRADTSEGSGAGAGAESLLSDLTSTTDVSSVPTILSGQSPTTTKERNKASNRLGSGDKSSRPQSCSV
jgi:hypothetical protein